MNVGKFQRSDRDHHFRAVLRGARLAARTGVVDRSESIENRRRPVDLFEVVVQHQQYTSPGQRAEHGLEQCFARRLLHPEHDAAIVLTRDWSSNEADASTNQIPSG
ncbi:MAG: hypothetical protein R2839_09980 [Thermomicrobiales bacterium]